MQVLETPGAFREKMNSDREARSEFSSAMRDPDMIQASPCYHYVVNI